VVVDFADPAAAATPAMLEAGGGAVVNIASAVGRVAGRGYLAYGTAKAALAHYTRLAAADLAPRIRVNAIVVGSVACRWSAPAGWWRPGARPTGR
jgi:7-alpha-hydroxysteroid dehydrogenase